MAVHAAISYKLGDIFSPVTDKYFHLEGIAMPHGSPVLMGLMVVVAGPAVEEVLYRFVLLRPLLKVNSPLAHAVAALAFGFQHVAVAVLVNHDTAQLWNIIPYAAFGLIQSVLYVRRRSLIGPILVHVLVNGLGLAAVLAGSAA